MLPVILTTLQQTLRKDSLVYRRF